MVAFILLTPKTASETDQAWNLSDTHVIASGGPFLSDIEALIISKAVANQISPDLLLRIAKCESDYQNIPNYLYDGEDGRYTAFGPFQILRSTALRYSDKDRRIIENNVDIAVQIFKNEGTTPWKLTKFCWSQ